MKARNAIYLAGVFVLLIGFGCGSGADDVRAAFEKNIQIMEEFGNDMDKAGNATQVAAAIDRYTREIEKLGPRLKALQEKHPELAEMEKSGELPEALKDLETKFAEMGMNMMRAMVKVMQYAGDSEVRDAQQRMMDASQRLMPAR